MSWFSLVCSQHTIIAKQNITSGILKGTWLGTWAFNKFCKPNPIFLRIENCMSEHFAKKMIPSMQPISKQITAKLLEKIASDIKFSTFFPEILKPFIPPKDPLGQLIQKSIIDSLTPKCEEIVLASISNLIKLSTVATIDAIARRILILATTPFVYLLTNHAIEKSLDALGYEHTFSKQLPATTTLFYTLTAYHTAEIAKTFWDAKYPAKITVDDDMPEVKKVTFELAREPIVKAINDLPIFKTLKITIPQEKGDIFARWLIDEAVELSWDKLHQAKSLGIPLVC